MKKFLLIIVFVTTIVSGLQAQTIDCKIVDSKVVSVAK